MSLILEALKKSEQQRRLGEAPTLASPVIATRRRRSLLPLFGLLIAIALVAGWWLSRSPPTPVAAVADAPSAPATSPAAAGKTAAPARETTRPPHEKPAARAPADATRQARADARTQMPQRPLAPDATPPNARPVPVPSKPAQAPAAAAPATAPAVAKAAPKPAAAVPSTTPPTSAAPAATATAATTAPQAPTTKTAAATATPPASAVPPPRAGPKATPAPPPVPSIWELPYATRKDIPELTLTMHVYSSDPAQRFVVVHGDRHVEGDDLGDGLILREIRPDDVVLELKGQRFTYPRSGR